MVFGDAEILKSGVSSEVGVDPPVLSEQAATPATKITVGIAASR
jgi:hypothetical protein